MAAVSAHAHNSEDAEVIAVNIIEVPQQTSLSQELLDSARDIADELDVGLRTRAIVGRNAGSVILDVIEQENADHVLLGWQGTCSRREHVLGSTIDPVIGRAHCDATLVRLGSAAERSDVISWFWLERGHTRLLLPVGRLNLPRLLTMTRR